MSGRSSRDCAVGKIGGRVRIKLRRLSLKFTLLIRVLHTVGTIACGSTIRGWLDACAPAWLACNIEQKQTKLTFSANSMAIQATISLTVGYLNNWGLVGKLCPGKVNNGTKIDLSL